MKTETQTKIKTALVILVILAFVAFIIGIIAGCTAPPKFKAISKTEGPPNPCPECPPDTNFTLPTWPPLNTNGVWLWQGDVIDQPGETPPVLFVVSAHNLTNGVTYYWERAQENFADWIPLTSFVATTNVAYRTNGIPNPERPYYFRLRWVQ